MRIAWRQPTAASAAPSAFRLRVVLHAGEVLRDPQPNIGQALVLIVSDSSSDRTVRIWDDQHGAELTVLRGHKSPVWSVAWSPDGTRLVTASEDCTARVWDTTETSVAEAQTRVFRELTDDERHSVLLPTRPERTA